MIISSLQSTLDELEISGNKLAVESKVRPTTIYSIIRNEIASMKLETLNSLLNAINEIASEKHIDKRYTITDIIDYEYVKGSD